VHYTSWAALTITIRFCTSAMTTFDDHCIKHFTDKLGMLCQFWIRYPITYRYSSLLLVGATGTKKAQGCIVSNPIGDETWHDCSLREYALIGHDIILS